MSSKIGLAGSIFGGAGTDDVMATDVYSVTEASTKTSFVSKLDNLGYRAADYIKSNRDSIGSLIDFATSVRNNNGLSPLQAMSRIKEALPNGVLASISKLGDKGVGVLEGLAEKVGVSPELVGKFKVLSGEVAGGIIDQAMYGNIDQFSVLRGLVNDSSLFEYLGIESEVLYVSDLFSRAAGTDMFSYLLDSWESSYDSDVYKYGLQYAVPQIIYLGDLNSMKAVIAKIGLAAFIAQVPNVIQDILTSYKIPYGTEVTSYQALFDDLVVTLRLVDPAFPLIASTVRNLGTEEEPKLTGTIDFKPCGNISDDAKLLFYTVGTLDFQIMAMHGGSYLISTKETLFNAFYPEAAIGQTE